MCKKGVNGMKCGECKALITPQYDCMTCDITSYAVESVDSECEIEYWISRRDAANGVDSEKKENGNG